MAVKICVTGHIDLKEPKKVKNEISFFLRYIKETNPNSEIIAISAMAAGSDTIFAQAALEAQILLKIILPFPIEDYEKDFKKEDWVAAKKIISNTTYEVNTSIDYENIASRNNAYLATGKRLVDESTIVLAVWDGKSASGYGGTGDIVNYAQQNESKELHIITAVRNNINNQNDLLNEAKSLFNAIDKKAINHKKYQFNLIWKTGIVFGLLGVFLFFYKVLLNQDLHAEFALSYWEFIFIALSVYLINILTNRSKTKFLTIRRDAEYLRSIITFSDAGIPIPLLNIKGYEPSANLLNLESKIKEQTASINNFSNSKRVIWTLITQQIEYQTLKRKVRLAKELNYLIKILNFIKYMFFAVFVINFAFEFNHNYHYFELIDYESIKHEIYFILAILPPIYAAIEGIKFFGEYNKDITNVAATVKSLKKLVERVILCQDTEGLVDISLDLRKTLEKENIDWATSLKEKHIEKGA